MIGPIGADTGPIHYLVLTGDIAVLPTLFGHVGLPSRVRDELAHSRAPEAIQAWISAPPSWLEIKSLPSDPGALAAEMLDAGERDAIELALAVRAKLLLMDDQVAAAIARRNGIAVTGTLGLLDLAARKGLLDLAMAFERLEKTSFYYRKGLLDQLLAKHRIDQR